MAVQIAQGETFPQTILQLSRYLVRMLQHWQSALQLNRKERRWHKHIIEDILLYTHVVCRHSTIFFRSGRQKITLKCVPHVQHAYYSPLDEWNLWRCHCHCCKTVHISHIFRVTFLNDDPLSMTLWCCLKSDTLISPVPHINSYQKENNGLQTIFNNYSTRALWIWINK